MSVNHSPIIVRSISLEAPMPSQPLSHTLSRGHDIHDLTPPKPAQVPTEAEPQSAIAAYFIATKTPSGTEASPSHGNTSVLEGIPPTEATNDIELVEISQTQTQDIACGDSDDSTAITPINHLNIDRGLTGRNICIFGLVLSWLTSIACVSFGAYLIPCNSSNPEGYGWGDQTLDFRGICFYPAARMGRLGDLFSPFLTNILVTLCTDSLGFIQTASLRWSLRREGRLQFNSNLRLLSTTSHFSPHIWYINMTSAICTSVCYAAAPLLHTWRFGAEPGAVFSATNSDNHFHKINYWGPQGVPFLFLGLAIMCQSTIATWCLIASIKNIPTWSSNPLNTTLACLEDGMQRHSGRCMMPVHWSKLSDTKTFARSQQLSASDASPFTARVVRWLWFLVAIFLTWGIVTAITVQMFRESHFTDLGFPTGHEGQTLKYLWKGHGFGFNYSLDDNVANAVRILTLMSVQGLLVFGLHCAELLVNMARDGATWRKATSKHGAQHNYNSIKAAIKSPQTISLFAIKATAHWAMGESFAVSNFGVTTVVRTAPIFLLTIVMACLACLSILLATKGPKGPQPASFGHIQTLADLVDEWSDKMYWGDKGIVRGTEMRHAGTAEEPLKAPKIGVFYGGRCCNSVSDRHNGRCR